MSESSLRNTVSINSESLEKNCTPTSDAAQAVPVPAITGKLSQGSKLKMNQQQDLSKFSKKSHDKQSAGSSRITNLPTQNKEGDIGIRIKESRKRTNSASRSTDGTANCQSSMFENEDKSGNPSCSSKHLPETQTDKITPKKTKNDNGSDDEENRREENKIITKPCCVLLNRNEIEKHYCKSLRRYKVPHNTMLALSKERKTHCKNCNQFINNNIYISHEEKCTLPYKYAIICKKCKVTFLATVTYEDHILHCNKPKKFNITSTQKCNESALLKLNTVTLPYLENKAIQKNYNIMIHCSCCSLDINFKDFFNEHINSKICQEKMNVCPFCNYVQDCILESSMLEHIIIKHTDKLPKNLTQCLTCEAWFLSNLNLMVHESVMHVHVKKVKINLQPIKTIGSILKIKDIRTLQETTTEIVPPEMVIFPKIELIDSSEVNDITSTILDKYRVDISNYLIFLKKQPLIQTNVLIYCITCNTLYDMEAFLNHILICLQNEIFNCPFCNDCKRSNESLDASLKHIKLQFLNYDSYSMCNICKMTFINEYNMVTHAQFEHFM